MARTTSAAVEGIIEVDEEIPLTPFIDIANVLVTEICEPVTTYDAARLEKIERYLSAHFYTNRDPRASSEGVSGVQSSYQNAVALGLGTSHYGQTAMLLDTAGGLARWNQQMIKGGRKTVKVAWLGTPQEGDATYEG